MWVSSVVETRTHVTRCGGASVGGPLLFLREPGWGEGVGYIFFKDRGAEKTVVQKRLDAPVILRLTRNTKANP